MSGGPIAALSPLSFACAPGAGLTSQMGGAIQENGGLGKGRVRGGGYCARDRPGTETSQTPASVTARPAVMARVSGSPNSAQDHSIVTGGDR